MKDTGIVNKTTREPYRIVETESPRYGHQFDVIDIGMVLPENRVHSPAVDMDHAWQLANSLNYWHGLRIDQGKNP